MKLKLYVCVINVAMVWKRIFLDSECITERYISFIVDEE